MAPERRGTVTTLTRQRHRHLYPVAVSEPPVVRSRRLTRRYHGEAVLHRLDLDVAPGEFVALLGRIGSGKSTLLRALAGLDHDVTGDLEVRGTVAMAFQDPLLLPWKRVWQNVCLGLRSDRPRDIAYRALGEVGLMQRATAWPLTLSGGEAQRAALARALVREPDLLLLDEPFSALDALTRISMHDLMHRLWAHHRPAVLLVTHDVDEALALADRVLVLSDGRISHACPVTAPHPRDPAGPHLIALRKHLLAELGVGTEGTR